MSTDRTNNASESRTIGAPDPLRDTATPPAGFARPAPTPSAGAGCPARGHRRRVGLAAAVLAAGAALAAPAMASAETAPMAPIQAPAESASASHPFPAITDLNGRAEIGQAADAPGAVPDKYRAGQDVPVVCQQEHEGALWDRTADDLWVPDEFVRTGTDGRAAGVPACDAAPGTGDPTGQGLPGVDISNHNESVDLSGQRYVYAKATEGTTYVDPTHDAHIQEARDAGAATGSYHFAWPNGASGTEQADYFVDHGGGWTADGRTLPGALDLEDTANEAHCYGVSPEQMVTFIQDFSTQYEKRTGVKPVIYTTQSWWDDCTGASTAFGENPLWVARYHDDPADPGALPAGWTDWTIYQYTETPLDENVLNGGEDALQRLTAG